MLKHNSKPRTRLQRAIEIRDTVIPVLRSSGQSVGGMLIGGIEGFGIWHRTPFSRHSRPSRDLQHRLSISGDRNLTTLPNGLDIWNDTGKVFNLEWDHGGRFKLVTFRGGDWEKSLIAAVQLTGSCN